MTPEVDAFTGTDYSETKVRAIKAMLEWQAKQWEIMTGSDLPVNFFTNEGVTEQLDIQAHNLNWWLADGPEIDEVVEKWMEDKARVATLEAKLDACQREIERLRFALETIAHVGDHEWPKGKLPEQVARDALENCQSGRRLSDTA